MNVWGNSLKLSIFGESHGEAVGVVVDGLPPGEIVDMGLVARQMARRAPGRNPLSTARREDDAAEALSGLKDGRTTGAPVCGLIRNRDARPGDYDARLRPGHADWTALLKYGGHADMRGGGHFSGRLTAPLVFAGALAGQILARRGVEVYGRLDAAGGVAETAAPLTRDEWKAVSGRDFPASEEAGERMREALLAARGDGDSVGGIVAAAAFGAPGGLGEPFFGSLESAAASLLFSVPAVKGVEFGAGFAFAGMRGSEANDEICIEDGAIRSRTNSNGGILGGITNGMPVLLRAVLKPTPSIARPQRTVDPVSMTETGLETRGRHDPCVALRAVPVVEACLALSLLDCMLAASR
ncbi:MAG: chorismate synthase [Clostridiales Family XIII bacterium]|jgi:chorismate synthase|nr:chorismate synthase [Clostridiales Family XIII bacterium]